MTTKMPTAINVPRCSASQKRQSFMPLSPAFSRLLQPNVERAPQSEPLGDFRPDQLAFELAS